MNAGGVEIGEQSLIPSFFDMNLHILAKFQDDARLVAI